MKKEEFKKIFWKQYILLEKELLKTMSNDQEKAMLQAENEANGTTFNPDELDNEEEETATFLPDNEVAELDLNEVLAI